MDFLIVKLSAIGDIVHALPAVAALRSSFPDSRITWVVEQGAGNILEGCPAIDELIRVDTKRWRRAVWRPSVWRDALAFLLNLKRGSFDVAFDLQGLLKSGAISALSSARIRLGFSNNGLREEVSRFFLTHQIVVDNRVHVVEKNMQLVRAIGAKSTTYSFPIHVESSDEAYVDRLLQNTEKFAIVNPGGGWKTKLWSPERFGQLVDGLYEHFGLPSLVTVGPNEEHLAEELIKASRTAAARRVDTTLKQFVALAKRAALFVGGDTGPLHLAAACSTPIVGIYGPTDPLRNGPWNPLDISVGIDLECRQNCYRRRCPTIECMDISVDTVLRGVERRLQQTRLWRLKR